MRNGMSDTDFKWLLVTRTIDYITGWNAECNILDIFKRPDGGNWGFMGYETHDLISEITNMGNNGSGNEDIAMFWIYEYSEFRKVMEYDQVLLLADIIKNKRKRSSLTDIESSIWNKLNNHYAHTDETGNIIPDIAVYEPGVTTKMFEIIKKHPNYTLVQKQISDLYEEVRKILKHYSNPILHEQIEYYVSMFMCHIRMMLIHDELESGKLTKPENIDNSTISMYIEIR